MTTPGKRQQVVPRLLVLGESASYVFEADGGWPFATVINELADADGNNANRIGAPQYEPITLLCGAGLAPLLYEWIQAALGGAAPTQSGSLLTLDAGGVVRRRLDFFDARIVAISFPGVDASTKERAAIRLTLAPAKTVLHRKIQQVAPLAAQPEPWLQQHFRLQIDGLDKACAKVSVVEPISVDMPPLDGPSREAKAIVPRAPKLTVVLSEAAADPFFAWFEAFVLQGNNGPDRERNGQLVYLAPDLKGARFTLSLFGLGIYKIAPYSVRSGDTSSRVRVELYSQRVDFTPGIG